jgi:putative CocE/NonD family hydrolase
MSEPGSYAGFAAPAYDGYERTSFYVSVRDGTKLALDLFRPTEGGQLADGPFPVVWMHTPYNRRTYGEGPAAEHYPGFALRLVPFGYNVAVVDFRGLYASYGKNAAYNRGEWMEAAKLDAYDITEWFAKQPWSNGKIGMWGCSATGGSQMQAATTAPPSLKAIFPMSCEFDVYPFGVAGGMAQGARPQPGGSPQARDRMAAPVDGPEGAAARAAAIAEHKDNIETAGPTPFRDSIAPNLGVPWWVQSSPHTQLETLRTSGIAMYAAANWNEAATKYGAAFTFNNVPNTKLIFGPGAHCAWTDVKARTGFDIVVEELRFFDYWLKGIQNGVMDEPGVTYYTYHAPPETAWRQSKTWPLTEQKLTPFFLAAGGALSEAAGAGAGKDATAINAKLAPMTSTTAPERAAAEQRLVYETALLAGDVQITGHPVLHLWLATRAPDVDVIAYLEDIAPDGRARSFNMHGQLRASRRALAEPPYNAMGLPWHSHLTKDAKPLAPDQPEELAFDLLPISYIFKAGHKIRLSLTFADVERKENDAPVSVLRAPETPSRLILPIIPAQA